MRALRILPQRNPLVLAKEVATLDYLSGGRIELGIGGGWLKEEFEALGIPFERRGKHPDEYVAAMRALWASDGASFAAEFVKFDKVSCNPKPVAKSVPIIVGGHSEAAARRAGRLGDGFFPSIGSPGDHNPIARGGAPFGGTGRPRSGEGGIDPRLPRRAAEFRLRPARSRRGAHRAR